MQGLGASFLGWYLAAPRIKAKEGSFSFYFLVPTTNLNKLKGFGWNTCSHIVQGRLVKDGGAAAGAEEAQKKPVARRALGVPYFKLYALHT